MRSQPGTEHSLSFFVLRLPPLADLIVVVVIAAVEAIKLPELELVDALELDGVGVSVEPRLLPMVDTVLVDMGASVVDGAPVSIGGGRFMAATVVPFLPPMVVGVVALFEGAIAEAALLLPKPVRLKPLLMPMPMFKPMFMPIPVGVDAEADAAALCCCCDVILYAMLDCCPLSVPASACMFYKGTAFPSAAANLDAESKRSHLRAHETPATAAAPLLDARGMEPVAAGGDFIPPGAKAQRAHLLFL